MRKLGPTQAAVVEFLRESGSAQISWIARNVYEDPETLAAEIPPPPSITGSQYECVRNAVKALERRGVVSVEMVGDRAIVSLG